MAVLESVPATKFPHDIRLLKTMPARKIRSTWGTSSRSAGRRWLVRLLYVVAVYAIGGGSFTYAELPHAGSRISTQASLNLGNEAGIESLAQEAAAPRLGAPLNQIDLTSGRQAAARVYAATQVPDASLPQSAQPTTVSNSATGTAICWKAPLLTQQPVYFEDVALERYGQTASPCLQPFISTGKFAATVAILPYKMGVDPIGRRNYVVGYARPGDATPTVREHLPLSARGLLYQAGTATGATLLLSP